MSTGNIIVLSVGFVVLVIIGLCFYFKKDYLSYKQLFSPIIHGLYTCIKGVAGIFPNNALVNNIALVMSAAIEATTMAEKMWLEGEIDKSKRNDLAIQYITDTLAKSGIAVTDNITSIIQGAIAMTCYLLPHGKTPENNVAE